MPVRILSLSLTMPLFLKTTYTILLLWLLWIDAVFLGLDQEQIVVALVGSLCGSLTLNYFRKSTRGLERILKIIMSAIGGIFIGTAINKYFNVESIQYIGATYFLTSFVILIFLRAILGLTEKNASGIVTTIFQRVFKIDNEGIQKETRIETQGATSHEIKDAHKDAIAHETEKEII